MKRIRFFLLIKFSVLLVIPNVAHEAVAKDTDNFPYVQSGPDGPDGALYARAIPAAPTGTSGSTEIYKVRKDHDERIDRYDWYTQHGVVLGWSPIGKVAVMSIRPQPSDSLDKQVELGFYLGGKHLKSWTTAQLQRLGAEVSVGKTGGRMATFQVLGCERIPGSNEYVFSVKIAKDKKLSFDILTGDLYGADAAKRASRSFGSEAVWATNLPSRRVVSNQNFGTEPGTNAEKFYRLSK